MQLFQTLNDQNQITLQWVISQSQYRCVFTYKDEDDSGNKNQREQRKSQLTFAIISDSMVKEIYDWRLGKPLQNKYHVIANPFGVTKSNARKPI